jgi:hypothetical protein
MSRPAGGKLASLPPAGANCEAQLATLRATPALV